MGISDASTIYKKPNNFTPSNQHYTSFDSSKILANSNLSKNLKEILSANIEKKNSPKLNMINSTNCFNLSNNNTKNNTIHYQKKKLSYLKNANISKTVDKKLTNNNIINNNIFTDSNNITNNKNKNNSS